MKKFIAVATLALIATLGVANAGSPNNLTIYHWQKGKGRSEYKTIHVADCESVWDHLDNHPEDYTDFYTEGVCFVC